MIPVKEQYFTLSKYRPRAHDFPATFSDGARKPPTCLVYDMRDHQQFQAVGQKFEPSEPIMTDDLDFWKTVFLSIQVAICSAGLLLNSLVIFVVCKNLFSLSSSTFFILNMAVSDFLSSLLGVPFSIMHLLDEALPLSKIGCRIYAFITFLLALVSITNLAAVSVAKYLTITKSFYRESYFSKKQVAFVILVVWIYCLFFSAAPLLNLSSYGLEGVNTTCSIRLDNSNHVYHKVYLGLVLLTCYILPLGIIIFCYHRIENLCKRLVTATSQSCTAFYVGKQARLVLLNKRRRSVLYLVLLIIAFLFSWTPYAVVSLLAVLGIPLSPVTISSPSVFAKVSLVLNPLLYASVSRKFRSRVTMVFNARRKRSSTECPVVITERELLAL